jgi:outer membrane protein OmpA-like peptidoglycan-associated protein
LSLVAFDFGSSTLTETEIEKLNALAKYLKLKDALILGIAGTADRKMDGAALMEDSPEQSPPGGDSQDKEETPPEAVTVEAVDNQRLEELAQMRVQQVRTYLIEQAGIDAARIDDKPVQVNSEPDGDKGLVEFSLSVK